MLRASWKSLLGRKLRLLMSALSIVLGVAFVAGSLMFTSLLNSAFQQILKSALADVNVGAAGTLSTGTDFNPTLLLSPQDMAAAAAVAGIAEISPVVSSSEIYPLDRDDRVLALGGAPGIAMNYFETPAMGGLTGMRIIDGHAPQANNEVVVDPGTLGRGGYAIGDDLRVSTPRDGIKTYRIVGTGTFGQGATAGASYQFFTLAEMQNLVTRGENYYTGLWVHTEPDADRAAVAAAISEVLPTGYAATSGDKLAETMADSLAVGLGFVNTFLMVFAAIALLVATLLILNTFSILVTQRSRELALLRAIGAKRSQITSMVLFEAVVIGLLGAVLGILVGYGLAWGITVAMTQFGVGLGDSAPQLTVSIVLICLVIALVITVVAALFPARKASQTRPVEAMTLTSAAATEPLGLSTWIGLSLIPIGSAGIVCGVWMGVPEPLWWVGAGAVLVLVGSVLAAAMVGQPILAGAAWLYARVFGEIGKMASRNAARQPRRTAATAATLMIGLTLVSSVAILASSTTASVRATLTEGERGDFVIAPVNYRPFYAEPEKFTQIDGVEAVWSYANTSTMIGEHPTLITGTDPVAITDGSSLEVLAGQLNPEGGSILLDYDLSVERNLPLGTRFELPGVDGQPVEVLVTGIINGQDAPRPIGLAVTNWETFAKIGNADMFTMIKVDAASGADLVAIRQALMDGTREHPTVVVTDNAEYADARVAQFSTMFGVIYALLALGLVISVLGIVNTLGLSVLERTREIGLLRAVGLTRRQLRAMVRLESVAITVLGSVLGVLLGVLLGTSLVSVLPDLDVIQVPWAQLLLFVVVAGLVGVLSAIGPARRAARMNVLEAIAAE